MESLASLISWSMYFFCRECIRQVLCFLQLLDEKLRVLILISCRLSNSLLRIEKGAAESPSSFVLVQRIRMTSSGTEDTLHVWVKSRSFRASSLKELIASPIVAQRLLGYLPLKIAAGTSDCSAWKIFLKASSHSPSSWDRRGSITLARLARASGFLSVSAIKSSANLYKIPPSATIEGQQMEVRDSKLNQNYPKVKSQKINLQPII